MSSEALSHAPPWWTAPGETDSYAFLALAVFFLFIFLVFFLYSLFDKYAEHKSRSTPLKTTIPTLLIIAFAYEILPPLAHFSFLLPLALIATALARDLMLWFNPERAAEFDAAEATTTPQAPEASAAPAAQGGREP